MKKLYVNLILEIEVDDSYQPDMVKINETVKEAVNGPFSEKIWELGTFHDYQLNAMVLQDL